MEETTDVKRKMSPSVPANYVSIVQLRERWIKEKERKEQEEKDEERRRNHDAEEQQRTIQDEPKKPGEDLDEMRLNQTDQKHWGGNSKKDESTDGGEARRGEEETAAIGSERGEDDGLVEKKRGRRKRYHGKKKRRDQVVEECVSIKPPGYTMTKKSVEKADKAIETQFEHLSIKRGQETNKLKAQTRSLNRNRSNQRHDLPLGMAIETAAMVWVKKGKNEQYCSSGFKFDY